MKKEEAQVKKTWYDHERDIEKMEKKIGFVRIRGKGAYKSGHDYCSNPLKNAIIK